MPWTELLTLAPKAPVCLHCFLYRVMMLSSTTYWSQRPSHYPQVLPPLQSLHLKYHQMLSIQETQYISALPTSVCSHWYPLAQATIRASFLAFKWNQTPSACPTRSCVVWTLPLPQSLFVLLHFLLTMAGVLDGFHATLFPWALVTDSHTDSEITSFTSLGRCYLRGNFTENCLTSLTPPVTPLETLQTWLQRLAALFCSSVTSYLWDLFSSYITWE